MLRLYVDDILIFMLAKASNTATSSKIDEYFHSQSTKGRRSKSEIITQLLFPPKYIRPGLFKVSRQR